MPSDPRDTPAMRQYFRFKRAHPDCILLFRIGDFYEMFDGDAVTVSKAIGLTLTQRTEGIPMAGVPYHQLETYLRKLIDKGFRVAVAEQTQDAAEAKAAGGTGVIDRAIDRVLTPGTLVDEALLLPECSRTLAAVCFLDAGDEPHGRTAAAVVDLSTGRFTVIAATVAAVADELARHCVGELLFVATADGLAPPRVKRLIEALACSASPQPAWHFRHDEAVEAIRTQFGVATTAGFGFTDDDPLLRPAGAIIRYLVNTQLGSAQAAPGPRTPDSARPPPMAHLQPPRREDADGHCRLDATCLRSLEVVRTIRASPSPSDQADHSLCGIFSPSKTFPGPRTAMGRRLVRDWLCSPLCDLARITARQDAVAMFIEDRAAADALTTALDDVQDVARIAARLALGRAGPRDLLALGCSLRRSSALADATANSRAVAALHAELASLAGPLEGLATLITGACVPSPPHHLRDGGLVQDGHDAELDDARRLQRDTAGFMAAYQSRLIDQHQLPSLKVGFNKVFGYFIELPASQARRAPDGFARKQTLKNAERFTTTELKEFEIKAQSAESRALAREHAIFEDLCAHAAALIPLIGRFADAAAELDVLACFAEKAVRRRWVRPEIVDAPILSIHQGRHPVLDELLESRFVPNDLELGPGLPLPEGGGRGEGLALHAKTSPSLALITGPNMAGKSTYIRTAALLTLLAHAGSCIPADRAVIGLTDRIFTRIGADDALHAGQSTFMVEMTETARILNHATARSLIILDEIGRGTSTLDGLSLAWAIAETLAEGRGEKGYGTRKSSDPGSIPLSPIPCPSSLPTPRTLFATHYHELTDLEDLLPGRIANLHVAVREFNDDIVFLHRILPGRTNQSYGIHVARLAGMPASTVARAREVLDSLSVHHHPVPGVSVQTRAGRASPGSNGVHKPGARPPARPLPPPQLALFADPAAHPAVDQLREIKIDGLSPSEALHALRRLKGLVAEA